MIPQRGLPSLQPKLPGVRIELTTPASSGLRSTTELPRHYAYPESNFSLHSRPAPLFKNFSLRLASSRVKPSSLYTNRNGPRLLVDGVEELPRLCSLKRLVRLLVIPV